MSVGGPGAGADASSASGATAAFGLDREWLTHQGAVLPSLLLLSHAEQLGRLRAACPEALPAAVVAGDMCLDRMLASRPLRELYRRAFGVGPGQRLVFASSTWGSGSLAGADLDLVWRLARELPLDEFAVVVALHPNVWDLHSRWQVRSWLAHASDAGVRVLPPQEGWRAALVAADVVVGDHGSVPFYGAALGRPLLLASFAHADLDPASPVAMLGRAAPRLDVSRPLPPQLHAAIDAGPPPEFGPITALASSAPGRAAELLRPRLYRLLGLAERPAAADVAVVPIPPARATRPAACRAEARWSRAADGGWRVEVTRHQLDQPTASGHLVVDLARARERWLRRAAIVTHRVERVDEAAPPWSWPTPPSGPALAASLVGARVCLLWTPHDRSAWRFDVADPPPLPACWDVAAIASAVHAWPPPDQPDSPLPTRFRLVLGPCAVTVHAAAPGGDGDQPNWPAL